MHAITIIIIHTCTCKHKKDSHSNHVTTPQLQYMYISGLQKQVEWPRPFWSVPSVGSLKRPKHSIHKERLGTPLMTRITINICNVNKLKPIQCTTHKALQGSIGAVDRPSSYGRLGSRMRRRRQEPPTCCSLSLSNSIFPPFLSITQTQHTHTSTYLLNQRHKTHM